MPTPKILTLTIGTVLSLLMPGVGLAQEKTEFQIHTQEIEIGPVRFEDEAQSKCPNIAKVVSGHWTGKWRVLVPNEISVCEIEINKPEPSEAKTLTYEQILAWLYRVNVPLYTIYIRNELYLFTVPTDDQKTLGEAAFFFIDRDDAVTVTQVLNEKGSQEYPTQSFTIKLVSIDYVYRFDHEKDDAIETGFVPSQTQVDQALTISEVSEFNGVPLFVPRVGTEYLKLNTNGINGSKPYIPMYFQAEQAQAVIATTKQEQPELSEQLNIQVVKLEDILDGLNKAKSTDFLNRFMIISPSQS